MIILTTTDLIIRIAIAIGLGMVIGLERNLAGKGAGMRTYAMVTLGSCLFILISEIVGASAMNPAIINPLFLAGSVITGIGFIGAGLILFHSNKVTGVTTAASLWVSAGIGIAVGFGLINLAVIATVATIIVFTIMWFLENVLLKYSYDKGHEEDHKYNKE